MTRADDQARRPGDALLGPYDEASDCPSTSVTNFAIDHAQIVAADPGECGASLGAGVHGDAEGTGEWTSCGLTR
jgi:hypothetical protein